MRFWRACAPLRSLSLGRKHSTRACDVRAPRRAGWSRLVAIEAHCASGTAVFLSARPCSDVRALASNEQLTCACAQVKKAPPRALSLSFSREEAQHARLRRARDPPCWLESAHTLWKSTAPAGRPSPSVYGRAPTCQPQPPNEQITCVRAQVKQRQPRALSLSEEEAQHAVLPTCARAAALDEVGLYSIEAQCASGKAVSLGARPCSDVSAAASKREAYLRTCASQTAPTARAISLSQEEAHHSRLRRVRATPR